MNGLGVIEVVPSHRRSSCDRVRGSDGRDDRRSHEPGRRLCHR
jgi:hypothetical protein